MNKTTKIWLIAGSLLALILLGAVFWGLWRMAHFLPGGADFARRWLAARAFLLHGGEPYAEQIPRQVQALLARGAETSSALRFDEPFYLLFFSFPLALLPDFILARTFWLMFTLLALVSLVFMGLRLTHWRPVPWLLAAILFFMLAWPFNLLALLHGDHSIWLLWLLMLGLLALQSENDEAAGFLFLLAAFRWTATLPFFIFLFLWVWKQRRWRVLAGFAMGGVLGVGLSYLIKPDWAFPWLRAAYYNLRHNPWPDLRQVLMTWWPGIGLRVTQALQGAAALILLIEWLLARQRPFRHFLWTGSLTLALTPFLGMPVRFSSYSLFFLPWILILSVFAERWRRKGRWAILALLLFLASLFGALFGAVGFGQLSPDALFFPLPLLTLIGLYWARWWAVRSPVAALNAFERLMEDGNAYS